MNFSFQRNGTFSDMSPLSRQSSTTSSSPLSIYQCTPFRHLLRQNSTTTCRVVKNSHPKPDTTSPTINLSQSSCSEFSRNLSTIMSSPTQYSESTLFSESTSVKVSVRLKSPANWTYTKDSLTINSTTYQFDHIITDQNHIMYEKACKETIEKVVIHGQNATIFTYGATNSGKTFTMHGSETQDGIVSMALDSLFEQVAVFSISYYEIYNETIRDMLIMGESTKTPSILRVKSLSHLKMLMANGSRYQHVEGTEWNTSSTRGHCVLQIYVTRESGFDQEPMTCVLNMIDLAGSEKLSIYGKRRREGAFINKSLLTLGTVISKLGSTRGHVPFRDSKLTTILQPFLQSGSNISVILNLGENQSDSLNTLAFGMRLRDMKPRKSHQNKYHTASKTERMLTQMNQELRLTIDKLESDVRECAFESQSDHEAWQIILQDLHQEKQEMVRLVENARRKLCEIVEINDDTAETLDDLINAVSVKLSWDTGEIGLDRKCQVKCVNL